MKELLQKLGGEYEGCISSYSIVSDGDHENKGQTQGEKQETKPLVDDDKWEVINFDSISKLHCKSGGYGGELMSVDALYVNPDARKTLYFIEFKSGRVDMTEVKGKVCESIIVALDLNILNSLADCKNRAVFVLVERKKDYGANLACLNQYDAEKRRHFEHLRLHPKKLERISWLFKDALSYSPEEFKKEFLATHYADA